MQPNKARMTFRFDNKPPASAVPNVLAQEDPKQEDTKPTITPEPEDRTESAAAGAFAEQGPIQKPMQTQPSAPLSRNKAKSDYQAWNSPYQDDILALEEMIRTAEREPASTLNRQPAEKRKHDLGQERIDERKYELRHDLELEQPEKKTAKEYGTKRDTKTKRGETIPFPGYRVQDSRPAEPREFPRGPLKPVPETPFQPDRYENPEEEWTGVNGLRGGGHTYREDGPSWMRVFLTVFGAIATGGLFGYLLLTLFTGEPLLPDKGSPLPSADVPAMAASQSSAGNASGSAAAKPNGSKQGAAAQAQGQGGAKANSQSQSAVIPSVALYVLQHGVFRTEDSMLEAAKKLREQGIAAATDTKDGYRVYVGLSPTKAEADGLVSKLAGTEVYVKALESGSIQIAGVKEVEDYAGFLRGSADLAGKVAGFASQALLGESPSEGNAILSIRTAHQQWLEKTKPASSWTGTAKTSAQKEIEQLNAAVNALNSYADKPDEALLWKAQEAVMNAVFADRELRSFIELQAGG